jgi:hypothetical protein
MAKTKAMEKEETAAPAFTKSQLVKSHRYQDKRDALNALLDEKKVYTFKEVDDTLNDFLKGGKN